MGGFIRAVLPIGIGAESRGRRVLRWAADESQASRRTVAPDAAVQGRAVNSGRDRRGNAHIDVGAGLLPRFAKRRCVAGGGLGRTAHYPDWRVAWCGLPFDSFVVQAARRGRHCRGGCEGATARVEVAGVARELMPRVRRSERDCSSLAASREFKKTAS